MSTQQTERLVPTPEAVRDAVADHNNDNHGGKQPRVADFYSIVTRLLGFDPLRGKNTDTKHHGGTKRDADGNLTVAPKDTWVNEHLSVAALRRILDALVEDGTLTKVAYGPRYPTTAAEDKKLIAAAAPVHFPFGIRAGWVLTDLYEASRDALDAERRNRLRDKLRTEAMQELAAKFPSEFEAIYNRLCEAKDITPDREETNR